MKNNLYLASLKERLELYFEQLQKENKECDRLLNEYRNSTEYDEKEYMRLVTEHSKIKETAAELESQLKELDSNKL